MDNTTEGDSTTGPDAWIRRDDDPRWPGVDRGFNQRFVTNAQYVALCATPEHVRDAVQWAVDNNRRVTVRSGGHCYEDFVCGNENGVLLDLSPLGGVNRDSDGSYVIGAGNTLWDVYKALYKEYGVTLPGGSCYSVGAGGHITGGGYGLLSRKHGLTVDYLDAVEMIVVDQAKRARIVTVSRGSPSQPERELLWANQGGGGGNFGVVTRFRFRPLPPAPSWVYLVNMAWNWSEFQQYGPFAQLVTNFGTFFAENSGVDSPYRDLFALLHLTHVSNGQIVLTTQYAGSDRRLLERYIERITAGLPAPVAQAVPVGYHLLVSRTTDIEHLPWLIATQRLNGSGPPQCGKYKSAYMKTQFPDNQLKVMYRYLTDTSYDNPQALLQVDSYGCQVNAVSPEATAVPQRSSIMKLQYQTYWADPAPATSEPNLAWIRAFYHDMYGDRGPYPNNVVDGCYVNYPDVDLRDWQYLYYKDSYRRLQLVKGYWDRHNIFRHQQSIIGLTPE
jgi:hypothetical protein